MRRRFVFASATLMCCGFSSLASAQHELAASPTLAPQLYLAQSSNESASIVDSSTPPSPFDIFADAPSPPASQPTQEASQTIAEQPLESNSKSVGRHHRSAPAVAIGQAPQLINNTYLPPIDYASHQRRAPNLIANYMLREWCTDGLWDNYAAERAAQCARQAERIAGREHCGQCGSAGSCVSCEQPTCQPIVNRYRTHGGHCGNFGHGKLFRQGNPCGQAGCSTGCSQCESQCDSAPQTQPSCGCAQSTHANNAQSPAQYANATPGPNGRPKPMDLPPPPQEPMVSNLPVSGKVALQPHNLSR